MKTHLVRFLFVLLTSLTYTISNAQCTIDQSYLGGDNKQSIIGSNIALPEGQSFKAGITRSLYSVSLDLSANNPGNTLDSMKVRVDILDSSKINGTKLCSQVFTLPISFARTLQTFTFTKPANVSATQMYTIIIALLPGQNCSSGDPQLIWYYHFPATYWTATKGTQFIDGIVPSFGNTQYFTTCVGTPCLATSSSISKTACFSYTSPSKRNTYYSSGIYADTITNAIGCDSVISINLTINKTYVDSSTKTIFVSDINFKTISPLKHFKNTDSLKTVNSGCDSFINHYINYVFVANKYTDTTYLTIKTTVTDTLIIKTKISGVLPPNDLNIITVYPNPAITHITIDYGNFAIMSGYQIKIENSLGQQVFQTNITQQSSFLPLSSWKGNGMYYLHIINPQGNTIDIRKIILQ